MRWWGRKNKMEETQMTENLAYVTKAEPGLYEMLSLKKRGGGGMKVEKDGRKESRRGEILSA